jgi:cytochrome c oxidase subunit IV
MGHSHDAHAGHEHEMLLLTEARRYHHFVTLALWLAVITAFEVVLIYLPMSETAVLWTLITLSVFKFFAVIAWFMHIIYDKKLLIYLFMCGLSIAFATVVALLFIFEPDRIDTKWFAQ